MDFKLSRPFHQLGRIKPLYAKIVANILDTVSHKLGVPNILQSANGKQFDNTLIVEILNTLWP